MHHNLKVEIERSGTNYVGHIELSTSGTAGRGTLTADSFDGIIAALKEKHDELMGNAMAFHGEVKPHHNITHPSEALARQVEQTAPAAKVKSKKAGKKAKAAKPKIVVNRAREKEVKAQAAAKAKEPARQFASE